ncbi:BT_3928 family protein [Pelobium manganitolerans]|uniref:BT_3928 family protein n=1 Tax=Pelobium manganitolerans TaxID=1842495 RepID=UPI003FA3974C
MLKKQTAILQLVKIFVALLFIFSGIVKLNDPLGFSYKLEEYFEVFNLLFLNPLAVFFSISLSALEVVLGLFLLSKYYVKQVVWGLLLLIVFFTFLTFYSAYFEVVKTCGCFGDAIPLTPWQSFSKDLILLVLIVVLFINRKRLAGKPVQSSEAKVSTVFMLVVPFAFGLYTYTFLPIVDFLPYKVGVNIPEAMKIPENAPQDEYEITYSLENTKTGDKKQMSDKEYLATKIYENPDWEIRHSSKPKVIKYGFRPKIEGLNIYDSQGVKYTEEIFGNPYYNLVAVAWNLDKSNPKALGKINALAINAVENFNVRSVLLTAASAQEANKLAKQLNLMTEIFYADAVPLKSMVRSNPGLILMKNGVILKKWPSSALPSYNYLVENYFAKPQD